MKKINFALIAIASFLAVQTSNAFGQHVLDSSNFHITWSKADHSNPERIDVLRWKGGPNLTRSAPGGHSCSGGDVEYFGNSWAGPNPDSGVLVGSGTQGRWTAGADGLSTVISSISRGCKYSLKVHVRTKYQLYNSGDDQDHVWMQRRFAFGTKAFAHDFRLYIPRLYPEDQFWQVLHPDASHTVLETENADNCGGGCQVTDWDGTWFAIHDPDNFRGMIVNRRASSFAVNLWVDNDMASDTDASSVLALQPAGGFTGSVIEVEKLCFYDSTNWSEQQQQQLQLPLGCDQPPK